MFRSDVVRIFKPAVIPKPRVFTGVARDLVLHKPRA
jgi:hypothetical protein